MEDDGLEIGFMTSRLKALQVSIAKVRIVYFIISVLLIILISQSKSKSAWDIVNSYQRETESTGLPTVCSRNLK